MITVYGLETCYYSNSNNKIHRICDKKINSRQLVAQRWFISSKKLRMKWVAVISRKSFYSMNPLAISFQSPRLWTNLLIEHELLGWNIYSIHSQIGVSWGFFFFFFFLSSFFLKKNKKKFIFKLKCSALGSTLKLSYERVMIATLSKLWQGYHVMH